MGQATRSLLLSVSPQGDEVSVKQFGLCGFTSRKTPTTGEKSPCFPHHFQDSSANLSRVGFKFNMVFTGNSHVNKRPILWQTFTKKETTYFKISLDTTWFLLQRTLCCTPQSGLQNSRMALRKSAVTEQGSMRNQDKSISKSSCTTGLWFLLHFKSPFFHRCAKGIITAPPYEQISW